MPNQDFGPGPATIPKSADDIGRRRFIKWMGGALLMSACGKPDALTGLSREMDNDAIDQSADGLVLSVRDFGALGDGQSDDTLAFALAISQFGNEGGTLDVPDGIYLINPIQSVRLIDNLTFRLSNDAVLKAMAVADAVYGVLTIEKVRNVRVTGGTILGERDAHLGQGGEDGHGIRVWGSRDIVIENVTIRDCWGDGMYVGQTRRYSKETIMSHSENVTIRKVISRNNRRQGLSVVACVGALIEDCEFTDTNGTSPESGIDLEPGAPFPVTDITIRNCLAARNRGQGIMLAGNPRVKASSVARIRVDSNRCCANGLEGIAIVRGPTYNTICNNIVTENNCSGIRLESSSFNDVTANTLNNNSRQYAGAYPSIILVDRACDNVIEGNSIGSLQRSTRERKPADVVIASDDCLRNIVVGGTADPKPSARGGRRPDP